MLITKCILLFSLVLYVYLSKRFILGLLFLFFIVLIDTSLEERLNVLFLVVCEILATIFIVEETKKNKEDSIILKFNPYFKNNILPEKIKKIMLIIFVLSSLIRIFELAF